MQDLLIQLQIGTSIEGGLAVVILAIYLDRVSAALGGQNRANPSWRPKRRTAVAAEEAQQPLTVSAREPAPTT